MRKNCTLPDTHVAGHVEACEVILFHVLHFFLSLVHSVLTQFSAHPSSRRALRPSPHRCDG